MAHRYVIVDDERPARRKLARLMAAEKDFVSCGEADSADAAVELIDREKPDLCFLDVQMPAGSGFDVLDRVRHRPHVIFTTAYDQYAVKAFDVHSLDYLLKPFGKQRLDEALERARAVLTHTGDAGERVAAALERIRGDLAGKPTAPLERLTARKGTKIVLLDPGEILWFESKDTLIFAWTAQGRCLVERTLVELEQELGERFFRTHRRFLVNLSWIGEILPGDAGTYRIAIRGVSDAFLPLSRRQARKLREIFPW